MRKAYPPLSPLTVPDWKYATPARVSIGRISNLAGKVSQTQTLTSFLTHQARGVPFACAPRERK
jgi:hypothetical protein